MLKRFIIKQIDKRNMPFDGIRFAIKYHVLKFGGYDKESEEIKTRKILSYFSIKYETI